MATRTVSELGHEPFSAKIEDHDIGLEHLQAEGGQDTEVNSKQDSLSSFSYHPMHFTLKSLIKTRCCDHTVIIRSV
jgi:hypothetical protein